VTEIEVGFGTSEYTTHILTILNSEGEVLWEGHVDGKEATDENGNIALLPEGGRLPSPLIEILRKLPVYHARWEEAWKDVTYDPSRLISSQSMEGE